MRQGPSFNCLQIIERKTEQFCVRKQHALGHVNSMLKDITSGCRY